MLTLKKARFEHAAGTLVFAFHKNNYGMVSDDERATNVAHRAVTLDPDGDYPFFTVPVADVLEEVPINPRVPVNPRVPPDCGDAPSGSLES